MKVLELFSGTGSVKKVCEELGWEVVSVDITDQFHPVDHKVDILEWDYTKLEKDFDIVWASPPCATFSRLTTSWFGRRLKSIGMEVFTKEIQDRREREIGVVLLDKAKEIIKYFEPKYYFIENPQTGRMKNYMNDYPHVDVDYCRYSDWGYKKRTRVWTNVEGFEPKLCQRKGKHDIQIGHKGGANLRLKDRYRIPPDLIKALFERTNSLGTANTTEQGADIQENTPP